MVDKQEQTEQTEQVFPPKMRAWVILEYDDNSVDIDAAAKLIYGMNSDHDPEDKFIIRVDSVQSEPPGEPYRVVVPIYASSLEELENLRDAIKDKADARNAIMLVVTENTHHPYPPHDTYGYVSTDESDTRAGADGFNTWG